MLVGIAAGAYLWFFEYHSRNTGLGASDFDQLWYAARVLIRGENPYSFIGPGREFNPGHPLYYPLPAIVPLLPFAALPLLAARVAFTCLSIGLLTYGLSTRSADRYPILLSAPLVNSLVAVQTTPLLTAAALLPWLAVFVPLKPQIGLPALAYNATRRAVLLAAVASLLVTMAAFAVVPGWVQDWRASMSVPGYHKIPLLQWGGIVLLLAALRWRRPEARLLLAMACTPHIAMPYDALPLALVARTRAESAAFALLSYLVLVAKVVLFPNEFDNHTMTWLARVLNVTLYLPCLLVILRRPNQADD